jgi:hypothetical protein
MALPLAIRAPRTWWRSSRGRGEAESYMERMNEESEERGDDTTYEVVEIDPEAIDVGSAREQIERGFAVQVH